jgi:5'-deoxynucleotidase YfbR-like HD superfamily hydrolase
MLLKKTIGFLDLTHQFNRTDRAILAVGNDRNETDVEHSYQLAMWVWWIIDDLGLNLNRGLAIQYALIHDLAEVYTGDKHIFDTHGRVDKELKEEKAIAKITKLFPGWDSYKSLIDAYRKQEDEESRLVYGLDKVLPVINIIMDGGRSWKREETTLEKLVANKRSKVNSHPISAALWEDIEVILRSSELELFGK